VGEGREVLTYQAFGTAARELAEQVAADGFGPDLVLAIARGGSSPVGGALRLRVAADRPVDRLPLVLAAPGAPPGHQ